MHANILDANIHIDLVYTGKQITSVLPTKYSYGLSHAAYWKILEISCWWQADDQFVICAFWQGGVGERTKNPCMCSLLMILLPFSTITSYFVSNVTLKQPLK